MRLESKKYLHDIQQAGRRIAEFIKKQNAATMRPIKCFGQLRLSPLTSKNMALTV